MNESNKELMSKRLMVYFAPLLPIDKSIVKKLDLEQINVNKVQAYTCNQDVHREVFSQILLDLGKQTESKPSYKVISATELIDNHFDQDNRNNLLYIKPQVLFITYTVQGLENSYTRPVLEKVIEERKIDGKRTFIFFKGNVQSLMSLKIKAIDDIVDFNYSKPNHGGGMIL